MFFIDIRSRTPIYEQLVENIKGLIINQVLLPDEQLPPVRNMAAQLTVNPNTIQKAYKELERLGLVYSVPGKGNFISPGIYEKQIKYLENLRGTLTEIVVSMHKLGMQKEEIYSLVDEAIVSLKEGGPTE